MEFLNAGAAILTVTLHTFIYFIILFKFSTITPIFVSAQHHINC